MLSVELKNVPESNYALKEAVKMLRTNVQFCGLDTHVIAITSCTENEGKSMASFLLAQSLAEADKKVLLIDADMRKSVLLDRYGVESKVMGLSQYLTGMAAIEEVLLATNYRNLHMIFAGPTPPNPSELLENKVFSTLVTSLRRVYDYIIIDTPPVGMVIDGAIAAQVCDGVVMVIKANGVGNKYAKDVKQQLERVGAKVLGVILNRVPEKSQGRYSKSYGFYGTYGKEYGRESAPKSETKSKARRINQ